MKSSVQAERIPLQRSKVFRPVCEQQHFPKAKQKISFEEDNSWVKKKIPAYVILIMCSWNREGKKRHGALLNISKPGQALWVNFIPFSRKVLAIKVTSLFLQITASHGLLMPAVWRSKENTTESHFILLRYLNLRMKWGHYMTDFNKIEILTLFPLS